MSAAPAPPESRLRGILLFCAAFASFATMGALAKYLTQSYPLSQIIWARYFFHVALMVLIFPGRVPTFLVSRRKGLQIVRGVLIFVGTLCSFAALHFMPLADVAAITFTVPLIATALSVVILREPVGIRRWTAVLIGFGGMLIIVRPGAEMFDWPVLLPVAVAFIGALYQIITRLVREASDAVTALFYTAVVGAVMTLPMLYLGWRAPEGWQGWAMLVALGLFGGAGHFLMIEAFRWAPVSVITPFTYTELFWAVLFGFLVFGDLPDLWTWVGGAIIVASGLYVWHRERVRRVETRLSVPRP